MPDSATPIIGLKEVSKTFGEVRSLSKVNFAVYPGEIVGLLGDNGAGKSTLVKTIMGYHRPDPGGSIYFNGAEIHDWSVARARALGIETVYQERALADQQELWRNIFAGRELTRFLGFLDVAAQKRETARLMRSGMGLTSRAITVDSEVKGLSGGEKQSVAIGRALYFDADLIILDEPTMGLSLKETERVLAFVRSIREQGKSAIFIDHNIFHVHDTADRFVILDRGRVVGQFHRSELTHQQLVDMMIALHEAGQVA
jgi:simple sugar transport system ATP-binding protein